MASVLLVGFTDADNSVAHADDDGIQTILENDGHTVTRHDATAAPPGDVNDYDCLYFGRGADDTELGTAWRDIAVGAVCSEGGSWTVAFELTATMSTTGSGTVIEVSDETHPIATDAGLVSGSNTVRTASSGIKRADGLGPGAQEIAWHFQTTRHVLFAYEDGAEMANSITAPARRVGISVAYPSADLNTLGEATVQACVTWAANLAGGGATESRVRTTYLNDIA